MHVYDPQSSLLVFALSNKFIEQEVALWKGVELVDFNLHLFFTTSSIRSHNQVLEVAKKYLKAKRRDDYSHVPLGSVWNSKTHSNPNQDQFGCLIEIKKEFVFSETEFVQMPSTGKKKLALLVPTLNAEFSKDPPIKKFLLKSLKDSLKADDLDQFLISIFIAYDDGDAVFDNSESEIQEELKKKFPFFRFRFLKLFKTNWLTFIWNRLFVIAYREGHDYFLQINDDAEFLSKGWLDPTVNLLQNASVVGLNDDLWNCKVFTQALVGRAHYDRFGGYFYPPGIKDWYSDNWITTVYGPAQSKCSRLARIKNSNIKTRYKACRKYRI